MTSATALGLPRLKAFSISGPSPGRSDCAASGCRCDHPLKADDGHKRGARMKGKDTQHGEACRRCAGVSKAAGRSSSQKCAANKSHVFSRYPVRKIHQIAPRQSTVKQVIARGSRRWHVRHAVERPAEPRDEVEDRVEQADRLPGRRQHGNRVERAAEKHERRDDEKRDELELLEALGPQSR